MKKLFGGLDITWPKLIVFAVIAGLYTGLMAFLPAAKDTSFADISISFEWWILFGIIIIVNAKSPLDSALKCFVFFLISQPLVYLVQVPFNAYGWGIFNYYRNWIVWTLLTIPMGYVGYYMKKDKWWGLLILAPMLGLLGIHYVRFLSETRSFFPHHLLSTLFCAATMIIYPLFIFGEKKVRNAGLVLSLLILTGSTAVSFIRGRSVYSTTLLLSSEDADRIQFDDTYTAYLEDEAFGKAYIVYEPAIETYMVNADLTKLGDTKLIVESPSGERHEFALTVYRDTYDIKKIK